MNPAKLYLNRLLAIVIDTIILLFLVIPLSLLTIHLLQERSDSWILASILLVIFSLVVAMAIYSPLLMMRKTRNGQTLGKQLMNIRAVQESGEPFDYWTALWRQFFVIGIPFIALSWTVLFLPTLFDLTWPLWSNRSGKRGKMIHDYLAGSKVERA